MSVLPSGYEIRSLSKEEFGKLVNPHAKRIFDESCLIVRTRDLLDEVEREKATHLEQKLQEKTRIYLALFYEGEIAGWSWGWQETAESFYMCNSAVLENHRRKGLYSALAKRMIEMAVQEGFQKIYSRHVMTNNPVLIAKLKLGFVMTHFELSDAMGALVYLSYFPKPIRKKILDLRAGQIRPDSELSGLLGL